MLLLKTIFFGKIGLKLLRLFKPLGTKKWMDGQEFHDSVFGLCHKELAKCNKFLSKLVSEEIKDFSPSKDAYKLKGFLSFLNFACEHFETKFDEDELYTFIGNGFLKFQKILNEE